MTVELRCIGAVLAGGASRRMGADKAFINIEGMPMVERAVAALLAAGVPEAVVVGGDPARMGALGLRAVPDRHPGQGPLGGVITALHALDSVGATGADAVVTLPCDVIEPDPAVVRAVLDRLDSLVGEVPAVDVVVPVGAGVPQWMHAVWRRRCRPGLSEAFARGLRAPRTAAAELHAVTFQVTGAGWFRDADRPEDIPVGARGPRWGPSPECDAGPITIVDSDRVREH